MDEFVLDVEWLLDGGTVGGADTKGGRCEFQYEANALVRRRSGGWQAALVVSEK
jgi:hypothetical protein